MGQCQCSQSIKKKILKKRRRLSSSYEEDLIKIDLDTLKIARKLYDEAQQRHENIGHQILIEFLTGHPKLKPVFKLAPSTTAATIEHLDKLKQHGQKLDRFLQDVLRLAETDTVRPLILHQVRHMCQSLGRVHYHHDVKYNRDDFNWFKQCVINVICIKTVTNSTSSIMWTMRGEEENAWQTILDYISVQMLQGILQETVKKDSIEPNIIIQLTNEDVNSIGGCSLDESRKSSDRSSYRSIGSVSHQNLLCPLESSQMMSANCRRKSSAQSLSELVENYSNEEKSILRKLWRHARMKPIGELVYADIFEIKPELRPLFGLEKDEHLRMLNNEERKKEMDIIKVQGCRLEGFLDNIIHLVTHLKMDKATEVCHRVGIIHYHKRAHFTADNWLIFKRVIIFHILEDDIATQKPELARAVLEKLMLFVTKHMKQVGEIGKAQSMNFVPIMHLPPVTWRYWPA